MPPLGTPLAHSKFSLNSAGVAGFFGGKEGISAMATVHLYRGRRWFGWFNSPGSYIIAKRFGRMANSRFWDGLFPGPNDSPAVSFGLDGKQGPKYVAVLSGTEMETAHLGYLTMKRTKEIKAKEIPGRRTTPVGVSYLAMKEVNYATPVKQLPVTDALYGLIPITVSVAACVMCALVYDWYCFSMILLGIISSGLASAVIGDGRLVIKSVKNPAAGAPPGHGILIGDGEVVVIKGKERDVNAITKGHFDLETGTRIRDLIRRLRGCDEEGRGSDSGTVEDSYHATGCCSLLLTVQFLLQLLLIPQGSLFGQIMFLGSLGVSWAYNSYLSSLEKEKIQTEILFETLDNPEMLRFNTLTRTTMAVFVCLLLFHGVNVPEKDARTLRMKTLHSCIPNDTTAWQRWRNKVTDQLLKLDYKSQSLNCLIVNEEDRQELSSESVSLLEDLLSDAASAFKGYFGVCNLLPPDSSSKY